MNSFIHKRVQEIVSTNLSLWEESNKTLFPEFYTLSTAFQTKGKGQDQNIWESEKGQNILLSTLVFPQFLHASDAFQISRWASLSILSYIQNKGIADIHIKWPNDIYIGSQKMAGILIQNSISGENLSKSMIGIGLNINQLDFSQNIPNAISLKQLTGKSYEIVEEIELLLHEMQNQYSLLSEQPDILIESYHENLYRKDEWHLYLVNGQEIEGKIRGVDQFGRLILENRQGGKKEFDIKEIAFVL